MKLIFEFDSLDELDVFITEQFEKKKYVNNLQKKKEKDEKIPFEKYDKKIPLKNLALSKTAIDAFEKEDILYLEDIFELPLKYLNKIKDLSPKMIDRIMVLKNLYNIMVSK